MQILGLAMGFTQISAFLDTNMLVSPMRKGRVEGLTNATAQCSAVEYRLYLIIAVLDKVRRCERDLSLQYGGVTNTTP